jgi:O-antigen/teichoic acid export membrane protein
MIRRRTFDRWTQVPPIARHVATLLTGTATASVLNFATFAVVARDLGPAEFGGLTLVRTFVAVVAALASFQTAFAIIKYGADAIADGQNQRLAALVKWATALDSAAATICIVAGVALSWLVGPSVNVPAEARWAVTIYLLTVLFSAQGTPNAVLRLFESYRVVAITHASIAAASLVAALLVPFVVPVGRTMYSYLWIFMAAEIVAGICLIVAALSKLKQNGIRRADFAAPLRTTLDSCPGVLRFVLFTNLQGTLKKVTGEADVAVIAALLGTSATGLYKAAKQFGAASGKVLEPLYQVIYPELARLVAERDYARVKGAILRSGAFAGGFALAGLLVFVTFAEQIVNLSLGPAFASAAGVMQWYCAGLVVVHGSLGLSRTLLALGRPGLWLGISLPSSVLYMLALWLLTSRLEVTGAGIAFLIYNVVFSSAMAVTVYQILRTLSRESPSPLIECASKSELGV